MIDLIPKNFQHKSLTVLDPAIGKGIFFLTLIPYISSYIPKADLYGIDIDSFLVTTAQNQLREIVERTSYKLKLITGNFLLEFPSDLPKQFDIIIGNPPHNALYSHDVWKRIRKNCHFGDNPLIYSESSIFFTLHSLSLLKPEGLLCFLLPKPIIYSKRWTEFRRLLLTKYFLIEVFDLGNQFSGQLQEQCAILIKKGNLITNSQEYTSGIWNRTKAEFNQISVISYLDALLVDNLLVGINDSELRIIRRLYSNKYDFLNIIAFRGLSSKYRVNEGNIPLIEKSTISSGFLFPSRSFLHEKTPIERFKRQRSPKIIAQRIISYQTKPKFLLRVKTWVDQNGVMLTHETVINIIPDYSQEILSLYAVAGLLESEFISWWLQHAVYTKEFVTSKDFDRAYINSIRIPQISRSKNSHYRKRLTKLVKNREFEEILVLVIDQTVIDQFYTLGVVYFEYQIAGSELRRLLDKIINESNREIDDIKPQFQKWKKLYQNLTTNILYDKKKPQYTHYNEFRKKLQELKKLKTILDDIVFLIYKVTPFEERVIKKLE